MISCAVGAVAGSSCTPSSAVGPSALSTSHILRSAGVLSVAESLAPVALKNFLFLLVLFSSAMKRRLFLVASSISSFFSEVTFTLGMPRSEALLMCRITFTFRPCFSRMAFSISSSFTLVAISVATTLRSSASLALDWLFGCLKAAAAPIRLLSSLVKDS